MAMLDGWSILKVVGKALVVRGGKFLLNAVTGGVLGEAVDVVQYAWEEWRKAETSEEARSASLQALAQAPIQEVRRHAAQIVQEVAADQPEAVRQNLVSYLTHVPATVRRSLRRASDPSGTTIPAGLVLRKADDLLALLPRRLPRFKEGDFPLANVDLELVELLGVGGFGEVWKARNPYQQNDPPVALKFCIDTDAASSLRHEAALLDRVKSQGIHPCIVRLLRTYLRADPPCLEYECIAGGDLGGLIQEWHRTAGGVRPDKAAKVMLRLAEIVGFAHRLIPPIVHRDLKPANVLVQKKDKGIALKVADFGIGGVAVGQAVAESRGDSTKALLAATVARGSYTALYASPQQMAGLPADPRDDVYALGVIWFQLLTGDLAKGVGVDYTEDLREAGVDGRMIALLGQCVAAKSERRPATATDLAATLKELLGESPATVNALAARQPPAPQPAESKTPAAPPDVDSPAPPSTPPALPEDRILDVLTQGKTRFPKLFEEAAGGLFPNLKPTVYLPPGIPDQKLAEARATCAVPEEEAVLGLITTLGGMFRCPLLFGRKAVYFRSSLPGKGEYEPRWLSYKEFVNRPFGDYGFTESSSSKPTAGEIARATVQKDVIEFVHFVQQQMVAATGTATARPEAGPTATSELSGTPTSEAKQLRGHAEVVRPVKWMEEHPLASQKQPTQVREAPQ
jgi:serine/threonine protein kinase